MLLLIVMHYKRNVLLLVTFSCAAILICMKNKTQVIIFDLLVWLDWIVKGH